MKNTEIPRYKASMPMQKVFVTNADKSGDHIFTQIARKGNVAVYSRTVVETGLLSVFETIIIKTVKAGTVFGKGAKPVESDTESYPGGESFGRLAWVYTTEKAAMAKFTELTEAPVVEEETETIIPVARVAKGEVKLKIPEGEFSQKELAAFNGFDNYKVVYTDLQKMLSSGVLVKGSQRDSARGKKAQLFRKA